MDSGSIINLINLVCFLIFVVFIISYAFAVLVVRPSDVSRSFKKQGITGPKYRFFYGNNKEIKKMTRESQLSILDPSSNDVFPRIFPHYQQWMSQYGETFLYWKGTKPRIFISNPELAKQVLLSKLGFFVKSKTIPEVIKLFFNIKATPELIKLVGKKGLVYVEGDDWVRHRRILDPTFSIDKLKVMTNVMVNHTLKMFEEWRKQKNEENMMKKEMYSEFLRLTADIIVITAFGCNYTEGIEVFKSHEELKKSQGIQCLNFRKKKLHRKIKNSVKKIVKSRIQSERDYGDDLLGTMLKSCDAGKTMSIEEIVDECKTFFFAGHETTASLLTWTTMLLSLHQDWQEKLREEVFNECGKDKFPDSDTFSKLKLMNMVLMESLRLYGPVAFMSRKVAKEVKLGDIVILEGTTVILPLLKIHTDKTIWGSDADKFNPMRFENSDSQTANQPNTLLAFSIGQRACIGQNFAMMEAKTMLVMILQRFRLNLSGEYKHAPVYNFSLQPQFGLPVMLHALED